MSTDLPHTYKLDSTIILDCSLLFVIFDGAFMPESQMCVVNVAMPLSPRFLGMPIGIRWVYCTVHVPIDLCRVRREEGLVCQIRSANSLWIWSYSH